MDNVDKKDPKVNVFLQPTQNKNELLYYYFCSIYLGDNKQTVNICLCVTPGVCLLTEPKLPHTTFRTNST